MDEATFAPAAPTRSFPPKAARRRPPFASGSEVSIAVEARKLRPERGVPARVVSVPCFELFLEVLERARRAVIGSAPATLLLKQASGRARDAIIGSDGAFVGMAGFGASAPTRTSTSISGRRRGPSVDAALSKL